MQSPKICAVVAIGKNRELGKEGKLLWHIPDDLKRFKRLTLGHPIIMGRKTFESIFVMLGKPLPNRTNIVVTRDTAWNPPVGAGGVVVVHSVVEAIEKGKEIDPHEVFVIGGAQIYEAVLPFTDKLHLTRINAVAEADTFFPPYEGEFIKKISEELHEWNGIEYTWVDLTR